MSLGIESKVRSDILNLSYIYIMEKEVLTEEEGPLVGSEVIGEREGEDVG